MGLGWSVLFMVGWVYECEVKECGWGLCLFSVYIFSALVFVVSVTIYPSLSLSL